MAYNKSKSVKDAKAMLEMMLSESMRITILQKKCQQGKSGT